MIAINIKKELIMTTNQVKEKIFDLCIDLCIEQTQHSEESEMKVKKKKKKFNRINPPLIP